jgi:hypothetical protein
MSSSFILVHRSHKGSRCFCDSMTSTVDLSRGMDLAKRRREFGGKSLTRDDSTYTWH